MYPFNLIIDVQPNNSIGTCWLLKLERDSDGELVEKCLYPMCDFSGKDAVLQFLGSNNLFLDDIGDIYAIDTGGDQGLSHRSCFSGTTGASETFPHLLFAFCRNL